MGSAEGSFHGEPTALPVPMARRSARYVRDRALPMRAGTWKAMGSSSDYAPCTECGPKNWPLILAGSFGFCGPFGSDLEGAPGSSLLRPYLPATLLLG